MKLNISYLIYISLYLIISTGTVGAHPHEHGELHHGPSLESYQTNLNFTIDSSPKRGHEANAVFYNKNKGVIGDKNSKSTITNKLELLSKGKDHRSQKNKPKKEQKLQ